MKISSICKKITIIISLFFLGSCGGDVIIDKFYGEDSTLLKNIPTEGGRKALQLYPNSKSKSDWLVLRQWPEGNSRIFYALNKQWREILFPAAAAYLINVIEADDSLYLFTYDVELNLPSGRGLQGVSEGIDIWQINNNSLEAKKFAQGLPLGGIDNLLTARAGKYGVDVCGIDRCLRVNQDGSIQDWTTNIPYEHEIVEMQFVANEAFALVRKKDDHITVNMSVTQPFSYVIIRMQEPALNAIPLIKNVPNDCLPYRLEWNAGAPSWACARSVTELAEVFKHDLQRIPHNGLGDIGLNNSEGRIAWSLVYTLNAMAHLNESSTPLLHSAENWDETKELMANGLELIARQGAEAQMGYYSRRYSLNREPLLFALHLGRIAQLLSYGEERGIRSSSITQALKSLRVKLYELNETAEVRFQMGLNSTLGYKKGIDFWADGVNVPYNYISGYVHGLLSSAEPGSVGDRAETAANLMSPLIKNEILDSSELWHYWWGLGRSGWSENVSINTPSYVGQNAYAHITYRSMDAMAVLKLAEVKPYAVDGSVVTNIRRLVQIGGLLPFVNAELVRQDSERIAYNVALRYARSARPSELYSQLFALERLAEIQ